MFANADELARLIDHTLLRATATPADIDLLCGEAVQYGFHSVCVNPCHVTRAAAFLKDTEVKVCSVIDFPLGAGTLGIKALEGMEAVRNGAHELDVVMNIGLFKARMYEAVALELFDFIRLSPDAVHKVIIETCYLTDAEKAGAAKLVSELGAEFVKTSTGLGPSGATVEDIALIKENIDQSTKIKASGGVRDLDTLISMVKAGAERIGTSCGSLIIDEFNRKP
jgi:deoxyribose-phosphate aldolase